MTGEKRVSNASIGKHLAWIERTFLMEEDLTLR